MTVSKSSSAFFILTATIFFYCLDFYFRISPSLIIPQLMVQYHINAVGIGLFASTFYIGYLLLQIPIGYFLDRYTLKSVLIISISCCVVPFILFLFCHQFWLGCILRFIIGAASAGSFISILYIARYYFSARWFNLITGVTISIGTLVAALTDVLTSFLESYFNWQTIMMAIGLFSVLTIFSLLLVKNPSFLKQKNLLDAKIQYSTTRMWKIFINPKFLINGLIGGLLYAPTSIIATTWGVLFMQVHYHMEKINASHGILYLFLGWAIGSPIVGYLNKKIIYIKYFLIISASAAAGISFLFLYALPSKLWEIYFILFCIGLCSSSQVVVWKLFSKLCPRKLSGVGIALTNMMITLTDAVIQFIVGILLSNFEQYHQPMHIIFERGLWLIPGSFLFAAILTGVTLKKQRTI